LSDWACAVPVRKNAAAKIRKIRIDFISSIANFFGIAEGSVDLSRAGLLVPVVAPAVRPGTH